MNFLTDGYVRLVRSTPGRIFLISAAIMFLELICIRWIAANIRLFGFFINFVLLAALLGIGIGILLARRRFRLPVTFPTLLLVLVGTTIIFQRSFSVPSTDMLFYGSELKPQDEHWTALPVIFVLTSVTFIPLGRILGGLLRRTTPLRAYGADIAGSLVGIVMFVVLSATSTGPPTWFIIFGIMIFPVLPRNARRILPLVVVIIAVAAWRSAPDSIWSSYYRITTETVDGGAHVSVNKISHQAALPLNERESFYFRPYEATKAEYRSVLVIGAGTGSDVAIALSKGADRVTAVEIDRELVEIGRRIHPDRPYDDPRVRIAIDDGRSYLRRTTERYDLIIFALTDSLTLTSGYANLRLESFLFTMESLQAARSRLSPDGMLVLYNYYREDWSISKLAGMVETVFGEPPFVTTYGAWGRAAAVAAGPGLKTLNPILDRPFGPGPDLEPGRGVQYPILGAGRMRGDPAIVPSTDDWPFFYLREPGLPEVYVLPLAFTVFITVLAVMIAAPRGSGALSVAPEMLFMGFAFMLLEARSLVTFALLFGTTWLVNALVFFAILTSVLISVCFSARYRIERTGPLYALLFALLAANHIVPIESFLGVENSALRYAVIAVFTFAPVAVANLIFSQAFAKVSKPDTAFAWNLIGIIGGGLLEYAALTTGYRGLIPIVAALYLMAFSSALVVRPARRADLGAAS
jgi:hypothetical protein